MSDELLPYYNRELTFIRRLGAEFAKAHPKIAGRLRLGPDLVEDPHVARLIEAFAYLNARIRHKIDDDFPEVTEALLGALYPHYLNPIPSMAIVQFLLDQGQGGLVGGFQIGASEYLETSPVHGEPCRFRTCYPVTLFPIQVESAQLAGPPFLAPPPRKSGDTVALLHVRLRCINPEVTFSKLNLKSLRFFLKGQPLHVLTLYELLLNNVLEVVIANGAKDPQPVRLPPTALQPVGFQPDEGLLPYSARSFIGYRLLTEYFAFPDKFYFVDVADLSPQHLARVGNRLEVFVYLNRTSSLLEQNISADTFQLGCTPMVNLFPQRAEPIPLTHQDYEYRVVPDARRPMALEVYSIDSVTASSPSGQEVEYVPFFSTRHAVREPNEATYWWSTRRPAERPDEQVDRGTEVFLSLVDLGFRSSGAADWTVNVSTTCLNRDLPHRLPFGGNQPRLFRSAGGAPASRVVCLTPPTPTLRPGTRQGSRWRLISHLLLSHRSLDAPDGADALREILKLYDFQDSPETRSLIDGIAGVRCQGVVRRIPGSHGSGVGRGVEVEVLLDEDRFSGGGLFLFASVLERFLAMYCSINSFSQLVAVTRQREGVLRRWAPRTGVRSLL